MPHKRSPSLPNPQLPKFHAGLPIIISYHAAVSASSFHCSIISATNREPSRPRLRCFGNVHTRPRCDLGQVFGGCQASLLSSKISPLIRHRRNCATFMRQIHATNRQTQLLKVCCTIRVRIPSHGRARIPFLRPSRGAERPKRRRARRCRTDGRTDGHLWREKQESAGKLVSRSTLLALSVSAPTEVQPTCRRFRAGESQILPR